ncbi:MAG: holo-ACP synthase [Halothiobacillaceae bacterium]|jgi:holo-[acyl-carrier protein] synthase|nr:holo-ACP synthase [Halothiobacillaceae bacterium]MDD3609937.1 holo-ACP synthase [Halothiobacillaceae bacterium]MDY0050316.1 holo-ACP synthase [Halothiobacillaceae bacterium]
MNVIGIGTDIVEVDRLARALDRFGLALPQRILAECEYAEFLEALHPERFLAKRFAAKEATVKALGTGFRNGLALRQIAVGHDNSGRPRLLFFDAAQAISARLGLTAAHLSLSDERHYAVAHVLLMGR